MFSNLLFVIEILIAELMLTYKLKRARFYALRLAGVAAAAVAVSLPIPYIDNAWYTCAIYLSLFALTVAGLKLCYNEPWINILFCGIAAYTAQHMAYQFTNLLFTLILWGESPLLGIYHVGMADISGLNLETLFWIAVYVTGYFTVYAPVWLLLGRQINKNEDLKIKAPSLLVLITGCLVLNIVLNAFVVSANEPQSVTGAAVRHISGAFNCFLLMRWQFELIRSKRLQTELDFTNKLLWQTQEQYKVSKENIDLINLKCHDMKHQIRQIGQFKQLDGETIEDLERSINVYDSVVKTDNEALDIILTEKSFKCLSRGITLNCIADGKQLDFMKSSDVYSLFGNALDNAIEAVMKLGDKAKRVIGLKIYAVGDLVTVNMKNFYEGTIALNEQGLPATTKENKAYHGFGMQSIRLILEKYGGNLSVTTTGDVFNLSMLIPAAGTQ